MNVEGTVAIRDIEPTIWGKGNVGGFERAFLAVEWAMPRHGHAPDFLATEGQLHNNVQVLAITEIDELLIPFDSQIDAMAATIEFFAKRPDKGAIWIKDKDCVSSLSVSAAIVDDEDVAVLADRDVLRSLPGEPIRQLRPIVDHLIAMLTIACDG